MTQRNVLILLWWFLSLPSFYWDSFCMALTQLCIWRSSQSQVWTSNICANNHFLNSALALKWTTVTFFFSFHLGQNTENLLALIQALQALTSMPSRSTQWKKKSSYGKKRQHENFLGFFAWNFICHQKRHFLYPELAVLSQVYIIHVLCTKPHKVLRTTKSHWEKPAPGFP